MLASGSPRRRELLRQAGFTFEVQPAETPEIHAEGEDALRYAMRLAREKATAVFERRQAEDRPGDPLVVLGADTVVVCDGEVLGKPADAADAARMLRMLSGRTHQVVTGVAAVSRAGTETAAECTQVTFQTLGEDEIASYAASGEPMDKAGAYAIQGRAGRWIPRIAGCYFNVVGLPIALTAAMLEGMRARLEKTAG